MTELQVQYFLEASECLNFTRVAEKFYISQPAVSKQISLLEEELGCKLFYRKNARICLTEVGRYFAEFFNEYRKRFAEQIVIGRQIAAEGELVIRLGLLDGWSAKQFLRGAIQRFQSIAPQVKVVVESYGFRDLIYNFTSGKLDIILDPDKAALDSRIYESKILTQLPRVLLYPKRLFCGHDGKMSLKDFQYENFVVISNDEIATSIKSVLNNCEKAGFIPKITLAQNIQSMLVSVQNELGVAIVDSWTGNYNIDLGRLILPDNPHNVRLAWRKNSPEYIKALIKKIIDLRTEVKV